MLEVSNNNGLDYAASILSGKLIGAYLQSFNVASWHLEMVFFKGPDDPIYIGSDHNFSAYVKKSRAENLPNILPLVFDLIALEITNVEILNDGGLFLGFGEDRLTIIPDEEIIEESSADSPAWAILPNDNNYWMGDQEWRVCMDDPLQLNIYHNSQHTIIPIRGK